MVDGRARWEIVYDDLREEIENGKIAPGNTLPAEMALVEQYGFSRNTVRSAILRLEQDGLITAGAGSLGRTVRHRDLIKFNLSRFELGAYSDDPVNRIDQWEADAQADGWKTRQVIAHVGEVNAPTEISTYLDVAPGSRLVRRRRLRYVARDGAHEVLAMIADTWTPLDIATREIDGVAPLLEPTNVVYPGGIYRALGFRQVRFEDEIQARMPSAEERSLLHLSAGTPVGQHARVGIDSSGRKVRVLVSVWAGDRQRLTYELLVPKERYVDQTDQEG